MPFNFDNFVSTPTKEELELATKTDLLKLATHYNLSEIKSSMRKQEIKNGLVQFFIDEDIFDESASSLITEIQSVLRSTEIEFEREKMQFEKEKLLLERERLEKEERLERERMQFQFKMRELEMQERAHQSETKIHIGKPQFDITKYIRLVPPFQEKEIDKLTEHSASKHS